MRFDYHPLKPLRVLGAALFVAAAVVPVLVPAEAVQAQKNAGDGGVQQGETVINADTIDYDLNKRQYLLSGNVDLTTPTSHMTSERMTVQMTEQKEIEWAKCVGKVYVERKNLDDGTKMTGHGQTLDYNEKERTAVLMGNVIIHQESPNLAKPAVITGSRVDMDLDKRIDVVHRTDTEQAKVHLEPKGQEGKPEPEKVDLIADQITVNDVTQEYVATGKPVMTRPSGTIKAKKIQFQVEGQSKDVRVAHAYDDVIYDGVNEKGTRAHATGDKGVFTKDIHEMVMEGNVHATTQDPDEVKPNSYEGQKWTYNSQSGQSRLVRGDNKPATLIISGGNLQKKDTPPANGTDPANGTAPTNGTATKKPAVDPKKPAVPADKKSDAAQ